MEPIRKISGLVITILCGVAFWYFLYPYIEKSCNSPIEYKIGNFDDRFGISQKDFLNDINLAALVWDKPIGKILFKYNPKGSLTINLIYDNRQKTTQENAVLKADADKIGDLAGTIKQQYLELQQSYKAQEEEYKTLAIILEQDNSNYNTSVTYWNNNGGAHQAKYDELMIERENLLSQKNILEAKRLEVNDLVEQINQFINKYNLLVDTANSNINVINQSAGKEFEEGTYDPNNNEINIYEFSNNEKLIRVLAHELGHALNLPHNENPKSIMFALNQANTISLSEEDIQSLKTRCKLP